MNTSTIVSKHVSNFQSLNSITEHPNGQVFVVNSASHCIHAFNADLSYFQSFGGKGDTQGQFDQPHSLAFDSFGNSSYVMQWLYESSYSEVYDGGWLAKNINGDGSESCHLIQPRTLCISSYDTIFVAEKCRHVAVFDVQGAWSTWRSALWHNLPQKPMCNSCNGCAKNESYMCVIDSCFDALHVCNSYTIYDIDL